MKLPGLSRGGRLSAPRIIGLGLVLVGALLLLLAYSAQSGIDNIGATNDPVLQDQVSIYENERSTYLVAGVGLVFIGLFAIAMLAEPSMPALFSGSEMISTAMAMNQTARGLSLKGNSCYLPAKHGLTREKMLVPAGAEEVMAPSALTEDLVMSPGKDGSSPGILLEPLGLQMLDEIERELDVTVSNAGLEAAEGTLQMLKHGLGVIRDFHFKERDGKTVLRVEYSGLLEPCRAIRKDWPDTCRQVQCAGCACLLASAARATGKLVCVDEVDNRKDTVVFTLTLKDW